MQPPPFYFFRHPCKPICLQIRISRIQRIRRREMREQPHYPAAGQCADLCNTLRCLLPGQTQPPHPRIHGNMQGDFLSPAGRIGTHGLRFLYRGHGSLYIIAQQFKKACLRRGRQQKYRRTYPRFPQLYGFVCSGYGIPVRPAGKLPGNTHCSVAVRISLDHGCHLHSLRDMLPGGVKIVHQGIQIHFFPGAQGIKVHHHGQFPSGACFSAPGFP